MPLTCHGSHLYICAHSSFSKPSLSSLPKDYFRNWVINSRLNSQAGRRRERTRSKTDKWEEPLIKVFRGQTQQKSQSSSQQRVVSYAMIVLSQRLSCSREHHQTQRYEMRIGTDIVLHVFGHNQCTEHISTCWLGWMKSSLQPLWQSTA